MTLHDDVELPKPGEVIAGRYRVERLLGQGGMGSVFEVVHQITGKRFAIKWLLPELSLNDEALTRFVREAQVAGRFEHPNVVEVYDIGQERGSLYLVMELLRGEALADRLERVSRLSAADAARILAPCAIAVAHAHRAGIIHRDLKPANIFIGHEADGSEHVKVLDFGISKSTDPAHTGDSTLTRAGVVMGTPQYMAPEQLLGHPIDGRADVYAMGVILYEVLSGRLPFHGNVYANLVIQIVSGTPTQLQLLVPDLPPDLIAVVDRAMSKAPEARFASMDELARALEPFAGVQPHASAPGALSTLSPLRTDTALIHTPLTSETVPRPARQPLPRQRSWSVALLLAAAGLCVVAASIVLVLRKPQAPINSAPVLLKPPPPVAGHALPPATPAASQPLSEISHSVPAEVPQPPVPPADGGPHSRNDVQAEERVIGPWQPQRLPGRDSRPASEFGEPSPRGVRHETRPRGVRPRTRPRAGLRMSENEF